MTRRWAIGLLTGAAMAATAVLAGCGLVGGSPSYRFRMTVEVQTPQGLQTGSSVMEVVAAKGIAIGDSSGVTSAIVGEAVVIDLPDGPIFVLLSLPDAKGSLQGYVRTALLDDPSETPDGVIADVARLGRGGEREYKGDLPPDVWPMMVRFGDIADPRTIQRVDPVAVGVRRIALETTREPVTTGIEKRLGWLPTVYETLRGSKFKPKGIPVGDFKRLFSTELGE